MLSERNFLDPDFQLGSYSRDSLDIYRRSIVGHCMNFLWSVLVQKSAYKGPFLLAFVVPDVTWTVSLGSWTNTKRKKWSFIIIKLCIQRHRCQKLGVALLRQSSSVSPRLLLTNWRSRVKRNRKDKNFYE